MVHFDSPARAHLPPSPHEQPVHLPRLPPVHAHFNGNLWDYLQAASPTSTGPAGPAPYAMNSGAAPDHARPLPVHPPGVVPNRPWQRLPPSTSPAPHSPHEFPLAHHFIDAFPPYRPLLDPSHARAHPPPTSQSPPWYTPHMQYFPPPPPASAPPTPVHKVWILDCKSCGTFLTNRGMKAVLLLRPNVPLYSTDALPVNCAAYTPPSPSSAPSPTSLSSTSPTSPIFASPPPVSSSASPTSPPPTSPNSYSTPYPLPAPSVAPRTCDCLTQSLNCTTCGAGVGYTIVTPCARCTTSISASQRATNGHRFVFYASEVEAGERGYIPGERGVHPYKLQPLQVSMIPRGAVRVDRPRQAARLGTGPRGRTSLSPSAEVRHRERTESSDSIPSLISVSDTSAPSSPVSPSDSRGSQMTFSPARFPPPLLVDVPMPFDRIPRGSVRVRSPSSPTAPTRSREDTSPQAPPPTRVPPSPDAGRPEPQRLKAGDVLFWHHLVKSGEIPAVVEDHRARLRRKSGDAEEAEGKQARARSGSISVPVKSVILAGR